jgi:hypothetical protein
MTAVLLALLLEVELASKCFFSLFTVAAVLPFLQSLDRMKLIINIL